MSKRFFGYRMHIYRSRIHIWHAILIACVCVCVYVWVSGCVTTKRFHFEAIIIIIIFPAIEELKRFRMIILFALNSGVSINLCLAV